MYKPPLIVTFEIYILYLLKIFRILKITKYFKRNELLILAYHGVEIKNESVFSPSLFITFNTLEQRMRYLKKEKFNVLRLAEALEKLDAGTLPKNSVVITVDDGWFSTTCANRVFSKYDYPYTVYVTSYYVVKELPVLNLILRYMLWSYGNCKDTINLNLPELPGLNGSYSLLEIRERDELCQKLFIHFNSIQTTRQKIEFVKKLSTLLEFDYDLVVKQRVLNLLTPFEVFDLSKLGVDIQLHTHRHRMPFDDQKAIINEIEENRSHLSPYVTNKLNHFCYPSGQCNPSCEAILRDAGIHSATTCDAGFITKKTNRYYLPRFLDGENIHQIIFEAEVCGVLDFLRKIRRLFVFIKTVSGNFFWGSGGKIKIRAS